MMWCIGRITAEYRERMYDLLALYAKAYDPAEPVVCLDEKSKQLLEQTRAPIPAVQGRVVRQPLHREPCRHRPDGHCRLP